MKVFSDKFKTELLLHTCVSGSGGPSVPPPRLFAVTQMAIICAPLLPVQLTCIQSRIYWCNTEETHKQNSHSALKAMFTLSVLLPFPCLHLIDSKLFCVRKAPSHPINRRPLCGSPTEKTEEVWKSAQAQAELFLRLLPLHSLC